MLNVNDQPTPDQVLAAREHAGQTQEQAAVVVGLGGGIRWSEYERGVRTIDPARWQLYLLATDQHPEFRLSRRKVKRA